MVVNVDAKAAGIVFACISIVCCCFILVLLRRLVCSARARADTRKAKNFAVLKLVGIMCIFDILYALKFATSLAVDGIASNPALCSAEAFVGQTAGLASVLFNGVIALDLFMTVRNPFSHRTERYLQHYIGFVIVTALIMGILPLAMDAYHDSGDGTCWIDSATRGHVLLQLTFFVPLLGMEVLSIGVVGYVTWQAKWLHCGARAGVPRNKMSLVVKRMMCFTAAFILVWLPQCVLRIGTWFSALGVKSIEPLVDIGLLTNGAIGIVDALVWMAPVRKQASRDGAALRLKALAGLSRLRRASFSLDYSIVLPCCDSCRVRHCRYCAQAWGQADEAAEDPRVELTPSSASSSSCEAAKAGAGTLPAGIAGVNPGIED